MLGQGGSRSVVRPPEKNRNGRDVRRIAKGGSVCMRSKMGMYSKAIGFKKEGLDEKTHQWAMRRALTCISDEKSHQWAMRRALTCISYQKCEYKA